MGERMLVYSYDKDGNYLGSFEPRLDPRSTEKAGYPVYASYDNTTQVAPPELGADEVAVFNKYTEKWSIKKSLKGRHKLNLNTGYVFEITDDAPLKSYELLLEKELYEEFKVNPDKYMIKDKKLVDISKTQEYQNRVDRKAYEQLIKEATIKYDTFLETPVTYMGHNYLPRYSDDYAILLNRSNFPVVIWDCTGLKSRQMTKSDLQSLKSYLDELIDEAYQDKKNKIKSYKEAISKLGE